MSMHKEENRKPNSVYGIGKGIGSDCFPWNKGKIEALDVQKRRKLERWPCPWNKGKTCGLVKSMKVYKEEMGRGDYIHLIGGHRKPGYVQEIRER